MQTCLVNANDTFCTKNVSKVTFLELPICQIANAKRKSHQMKNRQATWNKGRQAIRNDCDGDWLTDHRWRHLYKTRLARLFRRRGQVRSRDQFWRAHRPLCSALSDSAPHVKNRYRLSAQNLHRPGKLKRDDELNSQWTTYCIPSGRHVCWPTFRKSRAPLITETWDLSIFIGDKRRYWTLFGKQDDARSRIIQLQMTSK